MNIEMIIPNIIIIFYWKMKKQENPILIIKNLFKIVTNDTKNAKIKNNLLNILKHIINLSCLVIFYFLLKQILWQL